MSIGADNRSLAKALELLSQKTGVSPEKLQAMAKDGSVASLISSPAGRQLLQDPQKLERLLRDPKVQIFLTKLLKGQGADG